LSDWIEEEKKALSDVDVIRNDTDYELFLIQRDDGAKFYSNDLLRSMQSAGNLSNYEGEFIGDDPFVQIKSWSDKRLQSCAAQLLKNIRSPMVYYYRSATKIKDMDLVNLLNKALMALMMASNPKNLLRQFSVKSCSQYFYDFQNYLREALQSLDYHKLIDKTIKPSQVFLKSLLDIMHGLSYGIYTNVFIPQEVVDGIARLIDRGHSGVTYSIKNKHGELAVAEFLEKDYQGIDTVLKQFPNGPLFKALDLFLENHVRGFDTLIEGDLPHQLYSLDMNGLYATNLRMPSPTAQVSINLATPTEEFNGFLRSYSSGPIAKHHLLINFQDRTSWKEHARCVALEQLQNQAEYSKVLTVVTMPKETDFYYQLGPYQELNQAKLFIEQFEEHLSSEQCGFYFPKAIRQALFPTFIDKLLKEIHKNFFYEKNVLTRRQRLDFIELTYMFIQCKLIDLTNAYSFSFTCKDGIDTGAVASAQLFLFLKLLNGVELTQKEIEQVRWMVFAPALMIRERLVNTERFNRMIHVLKHFEHEIHRLSQSPLHHLVEVEFSEFFSRPALFSSIDLPKVSTAA
jgi:hypothetical protein